MVIHKIGQGMLESSEDYIPLLFQIISIQCYQFFKLDIFNAQAIDEIGKDTLSAVSAKTRVRRICQYVYSVRLNGVPTP